MAPMTATRTYPRPDDPVEAFTLADGSTEGHDQTHGRIIGDRQNVKAKGAYGTFPYLSGQGTHDRAAIIDAVEEADEGNGTIHLPGGVYKVDETIDLSPYGALHFEGGQWSSTSLPGTLPPHVWIDGSGISSGPLFYRDTSGGGSAANIVFENLMVHGKDQAVYLKDGSNFRAKNCGFSTENTGATYNTAVLLHNTFLQWFRDCAIHAPSAAKYGLTMLAKDVSDVPSNLLTVRDSAFYFGGPVRYIIDDDITTAVEGFVFDGVLTESASLPFLSVVEVSGTTAYHMQDVVLEHITMADNLVSNLPLIDWDATHGDLAGPLIKSSLADIGIIRRAGTISGARFEGMQGTGGPGFIYNAALALDTGSSWSAQIGSSLTMHADDTGTPTENLWWKDGGPPLKIFRSGDDNARYGVDTAGKTWWGAGGTSAWDTNLYRRAADQLKTDDKLLAAAGLGVGNSAAATEVIGKAVVKKIEVFDASGVSLGFVPVYSSIT